MDRKMVEGSMVLVGGWGSLVKKIGSCLGEDLQKSQVFRL